MGRSVGVEDLVAVEVGDRDLGGRDQVQVVARDDVHLVFLVRDLAGAARGCRVDHRRRPDLGEAVLARVDVEEAVDQRALEAQRRAPVDREPGARDLGAALEVDTCRGASAISQCGRRSQVSPSAARPRRSRRRRLVRGSCRPRCGR